MNGKVPVYLADGLLLSLIFVSSTLSLLARTLAVGLVALSIFGLFEQWPRRLRGRGWRL
jgi:hypothetical protein